MKRLFFLLLVFLPFYAQAQQDALLKVLVWGLPGSSENMMRGVAKKYGFEYYSVGGCVINPELQDSVKKHNDSVYAILAQRHGKDWEEHFREDLDNMRQYKDEVTALVLKEPLVAAKSARAVLYIEITPAADKDTYKVMVFSEDIYEFKLSYTYLVNHKKKKVVLL
ncbi:FEKKY domain-containing protein [Chitinophaga niabensis]|uniref:DUF4252 domain-containing protein n=1 Tax=Chitinophaga niabensis TaxID=536979 RepID=A0A1N6DKY3_9BACT|nr:hypothetical protein [Chitinophaga niabensis]SIN71410.1 hypothetical protein SAMN04488055_0862 [Chitinophaga niabensis]